MGIRNAPMPLEASRRIPQPALWSPWFCCSTQCLDLSGTLPTDLTCYGSDVCLDACFSWPRALGASERIPPFKPHFDARLLRIVSCRRCTCSRVCICSRASRTMEPALVAVFAAILLPPGYVLCDGAIGHDRPARHHC